MLQRLRKLWRFASCDHTNSQPFATTPHQTWMACRDCGTVHPVPMPAASWNKTNRCPDPPDAKELAAAFADAPVGFREISPMSLQEAADPQRRVFNDDAGRTLTPDQLRTVSAAIKLGIMFAKQDRAISGPLEEALGILRAQ